MKDDSQSVVLPKQAIEEFQDLYKKAFGKSISAEEAETEGLNLIELIFLLQR